MKSRYRDATRVIEECEIDIRLVEVALSTNRIVISRGDKVRNLLKPVAAEVRELRSMA